MTEKIKIGVIGAGRIGKIHIENLCYRIPQAEVVGISEIEEAVSATKEWAKKFGITNVVSDPAVLIDDPSIDGIVICSSTDTHANLIIKAAQAGKDIFCEKPIANDLKRSNEALQAVEKANVKLQMGFNRRFDPNFRELKDLIEAGKLGEPHIVKITSRDPAPPSAKYVRNSGGIFVDMTAHDFDMARFLVDSKVTEVFASGANLIDDPAIREAGDYDTTAVILKFENGTIAIIDNSRQAVYGYDQRVEVFGSKGNAIAYNNRPTNVEVSTEDGVSTDKPFHFFLERYMDSYAQELKDFVDTIKNDTALRVTGNDGLQSLLIALAANKSAKENRPVKISEIG